MSPQPLSALAARQTIDGPLRRTEAALCDASNALQDAQDDPDFAMLDALIDRALRLVQSAISAREAPDVDEAYERAAARARGNDFAETGGKDWT